MAEAKRKSAPKHAQEPVLDDDAQRRKDMIKLLIYLGGGIVIVAGMFWLSQFLSGR